MAARNSLFVDTSEWAYLVDRHASLHQDVNALYQQVLKQKQLLVTTNYVIAELVPLRPVVRVFRASRFSRYGWSYNFGIRCAAFDWLSPDL